MSTDRRNRPTLQDVAAAAHVSRTTASRVLNDREGVRPEVRSRVRQAMRSLGYVPDISARSLRSGSTGIFGLLIGCEPETVFDDAYFAGLVSNLVRVAGAHDRQIAIVLDEGPEPDRTVPNKAIAGDLFDGVIVTATTRHDPLLVELRDAGVPLVAIGDPEDAGVSSADVDNAGGGRMAARHLLAGGRDRIAIVAGPSNNASALSRADGAREVLRAHGLEPVVDVAAAAFTEAAGRAATETVLDVGGCDAVVAGSDAIAVGVMGGLAEAGVLVPRDVAVVGFDDFSPAKYTRPALTTVRQDLEVIAIQAIDVLRSRIGEPDGAPERRIVEVSLVVRESAP